jgi:hypothetical protein
VIFYMLGPYSSTCIVVGCIRNSHLVVRRFWNSDLLQNWRVNDVLMYDGFVELGSLNEDGCHLFLLCKTVKPLWWSFVQKRFART